MNIDVDMPNKYHKCTNYHEHFFPSIFICTLEKINTDVYALDDYHYVQKQVNFFRYIKHH